MQYNFITMTQDYSWLMQYLLFIIYTEDSPDYIVLFFYLGGSFKFSYTLPPNTVYPCISIAVCHVINLYPYHTEFLIQNDTKLSSLDHE